VIYMILPSMLLTAITFSMLQRVFPEKRNKKNDERKEGISIVSGNALTYITTTRVRTHARTHACTHIE